MSARPIPLRYVEETDNRRDGDRRATDRRAPRRWLHPLFAATLVNQIAPAETQYARGYATAQRGPRPGIVVNTRA
jgi:hypothetical protein